MTAHSEGRSGSTPLRESPETEGSGLSFSEILRVLRPIDGATDSRPLKTRIICRICLLLTYLSEEELSNHLAKLERRHERFK